MRSSQFVRGAVLALATLCFALGFGLNFSKSNLAIYLLRSIRSLDPELWTRDWLLNSCWQYHALYAELATLLLRLDHTGWVIASCNVAAACAGGALVYRLLTLLCPGRDVFIEYLMVLCLAAANRTGGPGGSYVFADIFQPSTLGSLGLLGGSVAFVAGRPLVAGLSLALAGAFHLNYLILDSLVFGVVWLLSRPLRVKDALLLLGPSVPVLIWSLPNLLASSRVPTGGLAVLEEARRILQDVRAPHHYLPRTFAVEFIPWFSFQLLAAAALWPDARRTAGERRLLRLLTGFVLLVVPAALLSLIPVRPINQLFAWRISPHATLLAQAALVAMCGGALRGLPPEPFSSWNRGRQVVAALGAFGLLAAGVVSRARPSALLALAFCVLALVAQRWYRVGAFRDFAERSLYRVLEIALAVTFAVASFEGLASLHRKSDLLGDRDPDQMALCSWLEATTPKNALLLAPPEDGHWVRFQCQRAVVVDWRGAPALPNELLEWSSRLEAVTNRPLRSSADLAGYAELDGTRLRGLMARFGFDIVVVKRGSALDLNRPPDFAHGRLLAYRVR